MIKVEIWSDVVCPFCYVGKERFENVLSTFEYKDQVEVIWKSFELDPISKPAPNTSALDDLARKKGWSQSQINESTQYLTQIGKVENIDFQFNKSKAVNTNHLHRLLHLAAAYQLQNELKLAFFKVYFTNGIDLNVETEVIKITSALGLPTDKVTEVLHSDLYAAEVKADQLQAQKIGVRGVPFFVFNNEFAVSGAQERRTFAEALQKAKEGHVIAITDNNPALACDVDNPNC